MRGKEKNVQGHEMSELEWGKHYFLYSRKIALIYTYTHIHTHTYSSRVSFFTHKRTNGKTV
jgi:hypothetical protein